MTLLHMALRARTRSVDAGNHPLRDTLLGGVSQICSVELHLEVRFLAQNADKALPL